jgi:ATP-dependent Lon protease
MQVGSAEYTVVRTYLDWILDIPWTNSTPDNLEISQVRKVLDEDHYGLEKVKKRILEYLAVRKLKQDKKGPILCLLGPPGVGKTSLGRSIARALGRKFHRISLGGVHDEAAIRGHRRTYVGALPGQIIQGMKKVGHREPGVHARRGRQDRPRLPRRSLAALLEVLDPEQNNTFADHYLEIPYDLSHVMFIATANVADPIPPPLRDRMEILEIPGYTRREKLAIARQHLLPKQLSEHGLTTEQLEITDRALEEIIDHYTREAGVRSLERQVASVIRGVAVKVAEGEAQQAPRRQRGRPARVPGALALHERGRRAHRGDGRGHGPRVDERSAARSSSSRRRACTAAGKLQLTGQLGDVMKESAQAALSFVRANALKYGIAKDFLEKSDLHIHIPAGAMPKDGPSAGVTMFTALVSLLTGIKVRHDVAMTGEITLRGRVLPIGGLKEKVLAAHRAGIKRIVLPERNGPTSKRCRKEVLDELEFFFVSRMEQVLEAALEPLVSALRSPPTSPASPCCARCSPSSASCSAKAARPTRR